MDIVTYNQGCAKRSNLLVGILIICKGKYHGEEGGHFAGDLICAGEILADAVEVLKPYLTSGEGTAKAMGADDWAYSPQKTVRVCTAWAAEQA